MKKIFLMVMIAVGVALTSACGKAQVSPHPELLDDKDQPEINLTATVEVIVNAAANDGSANNAVYLFFDYLHTGRYEDAVNLYNGSYQVMVDQNPSIDAADHVKLMKSACTVNGFQCLQLKVAGIEYKPSPNEYLFTVQFQNDDGSLFVLGPCCGASETEQPPVSLFEVRVTQVAEGEFRILDMPPYMP